MGVLSLQDMDETAGWGPYEAFDTELECEEGDCEAAFLRPEECWEPGEPRLQMQRLLDQAWWKAHPSLTQSVQMET